MTEESKRELTAKDEARLGKDRRENGEGGLSWSVYDKKWIGSVELPPDPQTGKRRRKRIKHADRITALEMLQDLRVKVAKGDIAPTKKRGITTAGHWLDYWIEEIAKPNIKPKTLQSYRGTINHHIKPCIGGVRLDKLSPHHIREMYKAINAKSKIGSTRTARLAHAVLAVSLEKAWKEGFVTENIMKKVDKPAYNPTLRGSLTADQSLQLLSNCLEREDRYTTRIAAALMTGARQGELIGLQWDRVDLANATIELSWQLQELRQKHGCLDEDGKQTCDYNRAGSCPERYFEVPPAFEYRKLEGALCLTRPKTEKSRRSVPIPEQLQQTLAFHFAETQHEPNPHNLVWHKPNGKPLSPTQDAKHWAQALKLAGLPHVPLHGARHTTASLLLSAKVDVHVIMEILGHTVMATTRNYTHVPAELTRKSVAPLGGLLEIARKG